MRKGSEAKAAGAEARVEGRMTRLRDPNADLGDRLAALDDLLACPGLGPVRGASVAIYARELARAVAEHGPIARGGMQWYVNEAGDLRRRLPT